MENTDRRLAATISSVILGGALISALAFNTGCVAVIGTPKGIKAYADGQAGLVVTGKAKPNVADSYFLHRDREETEITQRENHDGFFTRLLKGSDKQS